MSDAAWRRLLDLVGSLVSTSLMARWRVGLAGHRDLGWVEPDRVVHFCNNFPVADTDAFPQFRIFVPLDDKRNLRRQQMTILSNVRQQMTVHSHVNRFG